MNRTPQAEARRKVNQSKTWYSRLVEKNRLAEEAYRQKIARLEQGLTDLLEEQAQDA
jgi:hypothetical protein